MPSPQPRTLAFIGAGNMSRAIIGGLHNNHYPADHIIASNPSQGKLTALQQDFGIATTTDNVQAVRQAQVIVLAVKPQLMQQVCQPLVEAGDLHNKLFVSIAAGISYQRLSQMLGGQHNIVRTMPNTPSAIGLGMTGIYLPQQVNRDDGEFANFLLQQVGKTLVVKEEHLLDGVIAAAGSAPAYFFLFLEAMQKQAQAAGFSQTEARMLVEQAMLGSAHMVCHNSDLELHQLRAQVTSKGGTTAKAVEYFQQQDLEATVAGAMRSAVARARQMSNDF